MLLHIYISNQQISYTVHHISSPFTIYTYEIPKPLQWVLSISPFHDQHSICTQCNLVNVYMRLFLFLRSKLLGQMQLISFYLNVIKVVKSPIKLHYEVTVYQDFRVKRSKLFYSDCFCQAGQYNFFPRNLTTQER